MAECGHFRRHWTVVYEGDTVTSRLYCTDCRVCLRTIPGAFAAVQMQRKGRAADA
jgi:hypothetical protein